MAKCKVLKSIAHNHAHSFTSLMNYRGGDYVMGHLLRYARQSGVHSWRVDILSGLVVPPLGVAGAIAESIASYTEWFPTHVASQGAEMTSIAAASMSLSFDLTQSRPVHHAPQYLESPYICRVEITDNRGKLWTAELRDWWYPESGTLEPRASATTLFARLSKAIRSIWQTVRATPWLHHNVRWSRQGGY